MLMKYYLIEQHTGSTNHSTCPAVMPSPQKRKRKHLANRKFPRKKTPWNSHRLTSDGAVHRPDETTNITSLHQTLKKKNSTILKLLFLMKVMLLFANANLFISIM